MEPRGCILVELPRFNRKVEKHTKKCPISMITYGLSQALFPTNRLQPLFLNFLLSARLEH